MEISLVCEECGNDLEASFQGQRIGVYHADQSASIAVKPCEKCLEKEREAGRAEAEEG